MITNNEYGTTVTEVARDLYRISTPIPPETVPGGFSFNQYLLVDEAPLLFHTGPRRMFPLVREAIDSVIPVESLHWIAFSHVEADECGGLNDLLAVAPEARPLCGNVAAMVSIEDLADRAPRAMADGETISLGARQLEWIDAPHLPHGWETGYLIDRTNRVLMCGDLFTQPGTGGPALTEEDILEPSEAFRQQMDYYAHSRHAAKVFERLIGLSPETLACMHGSAWRGDGGALLGELAKRLGV